jgi:hypothetical protein
VGVDFVLRGPRCCSLRVDFYIEKTTLLLFRDLL